jgi:hypothetical protein
MKEFHHLLAIRRRSRANGRLIRWVDLAENERYGNEEESATNQSQFGVHENRGCDVMSKKKRTFVTARHPLAAGGTTLAFPECRFHPLRFKHTSRKKKNVPLVF